MTPYRTRKVRVLNGAHTSTVPAAFLAGFQTVGEMMDDPDFGPLARRAVFDEILPQLQMDAQERESYADAVIERFLNPFIRHELISIMLNCVSKWKVRVLPSLLDSLAIHRHAATCADIFVGCHRSASTTAEKSRPPNCAAPAMARRIRSCDDAPVLAFFLEQWTLYRADGDTARLVESPRWPMNRSGARISARSPA